MRFEWPARSEHIHWKKHGFRQCARQAGHGQSRPIDWLTTGAKLCRDCLSQRDIIVAIFVFANWVGWRYLSVWPATFAGAVKIKDSRRLGAHDGASLLDIVPSFIRPLRRMRVSRASKSWTLIGVGCGGHPPWCVAARLRRAGARRCMRMIFIAKTGNRFAIKIMRR